ncbi:hypothetical protein [Novosphingobium guangzhouense]|uniref:Uncharacterized protein n=1 Tax=Novosphingobium guangzhouense TaxID=1850347 RepID=A0A2K2FUT9_9SPHN|nr:hypothetical protein [Novosphingobium guangzhouense]PNU02551.1 hypothetical protein A8V01_09250 [Novosphingobium guangzhouense]
MRDVLILRKLKVWCLLLLAAVFAHALIPVEARASGSAFSPSTAEVSTGHSLRVAAVRKLAPQRDPLGRGLLLAASSRSQDVQDARACPASPAAVAPPGWRCALSQPRAPPFA